MKLESCIHLQGLTNPLSGCPGQVKIFAGQVKQFLTCPEKCINYIGKTNEFQGFLAEAICRTSRSDFDLSSPDLEELRSTLCSILRLDLLFMVH